MLQLTARDARHFGEASQALVSPHDYPRCAAWRAGVALAVRALFAADRALLLGPAQPDLAPGALTVAGTPPDAWWPAIAHAPAEFALQDSAGRLGAQNGGPVLLGPSTGEGLTAFRGWPAAVPLPVSSSSTRRTTQGVTADGEFGVRPPAWAWVHLAAGGGGNGALLIVGSFGTRSGRFTETDALLLGAMLRPAFVAGVRHACTRWGPRWGAFGDASRPIAAQPFSEPSPGAAVRIRSCDDAQFSSVRGTTGAPETPLAAAHLTAREHEIAGLLAQRRTNREIAEALTITEHTARHHTERVLRKLGLSTRRDVPRR
ncbi:MAG TPA: helix-turn-helix transcriptional regulator [Gemmatirosa sp.]